MKSQIVIVAAALAALSSAPMFAAAADAPAAAPVAAAPAAAPADAAVAKPMHKKHRHHKMKATDAATTAK